MDIPLYYCTMCGQGFNYRSRVSGHHNTCPKKNCPDLYQPRVPIDEKIKETFRRKAAIPVNIKKEILAIAEEEMEKDIEASQIKSTLGEQFGEQGGASSQVPTGKPQVGGVPAQVLTGQPQQQPKILQGQGVGELLHQMSEGHLTAEAIEINPEESKSVEKLLDIENVFEEQK